MSTDLFDDIEVLPDPPPEEDTHGSPSDEVTGPTCEECGTLIEWSGRGRRPKRCKDHRTRTAATPDAQRPRRTGKRETRIAAVEADLLREMVAFGNGISKPLPVTGVTVVGRAEGTARALARLAEDSDRLLEALEVVTKVAPVIDLGETGMSVGVAILVDTHRMKPDAVPAVMTGVSATWHEIYEDSPEVVVTDVASGFEVQVPPRFARIA